MALYYEFGYRSYRNAYVFDEVWYVSTSRNILYKVFGLSDIKTNNTNYNYYTIVFNSKPNTALVKDIILKHKECYVFVEDNYTSSIPANVTITMSNTSTVFTAYIGKGLNAVYVAVKNSPNCSIKSLIKDLNKTNNSIIDIVPGWALPDIRGINNYFNLEHPPLGKYLIIISILLLGDHPVAWRIPSLICTSLIFVLAYIITREILIDFLKPKYATLISLITLILMYFDNIYHRVGILAILDPSLAFFTILGVYFFIKCPYGKTTNQITRTIIFSLAGIIKFSGLFIVPADIIEGFLVKGNILKKLRHGFGAILRYYAVFPLILILFSLPLIQYFGPITWYKVSIEGAIRWHTSTKLLTNTTYYSPLDWFLGRHAIILWTDIYTRTPVKAVGIPQVYLSSLVIGYILFPLIYNLPKFRRLITSSNSIILMYILLYIIGNKSLFSYYIIQFVAILEIQLVVSVIFVLYRLVQVKMKKKA